MNNFIDMSGKRFGRLTVLNSFKRNKHGMIMWDCLCDCGTTVCIIGSDIRRGRSKSCGCLHEELISAGTNKMHGLSRTPIYGAWKNAVNRTTNPSNEFWKDYGGRGIQVCKEWLESVECFYDDMGATWKEGLTLDRIDVNGDYCKDNCRWTSFTVQGHNKRKTEDCSAAYTGVYFNKEKGKFQAQIKQNGKAIYLGRYALEIDAATAYDNRSEELYGDRPNGTVKEELKC